MLTAHAAVSAKLLKRALRSERLAAAPTTAGTPPSTLPTAAAAAAPAPAWPVAPAAAAATAAAAKACTAELCK